MEVKEKSDRHKCSVCLKDADLVCKACKGTPDGAKGITAIYYCSAACQKEDWKAHKPKCRASKDRQILYRAGGFAQRLWMSFCKKTWQWVIDEVEVIDLGLIKWEDIGRIYFGEYWEVRHGRCTPSMKNYLLPFPIERFPDVGQQEALLTQSRCRDALFIMDDIINDLLQDINVKIVEVELRIKNPGMMLIHVRPDGTRAEIPAQHPVFKITLPNKESHALDFTAAQYGWYGPAMIPWAIFEEQRLDTVLDTRGFGAMTKDFLAEARESKSTENHFAKVLEILKKRFKDGLAEWQQQNLSFQALLKCSEEDFAKKQSLLFTFMDRWMSKEIIKINKVTRVSASAG